MSDWIQHVIGEPEDGTQRCVICGKIIVDYRNVMYLKEQGPPSWWTPGPIYQKGGTTMLGEPENFKSCA